MRRIATVLIFTLAAGAAQACSWPKGTPSPIERNVAFSTGCELLLLATMLISTVIAFRHKRFYWIPCAMALLIYITWQQIRHAYDGDCGTVAASSALLSAALGLAGLNAQFLAAREKARKEKALRLDPKS